MTINLTEEQYAQLKEDKILDIVSPGDGIRVYIEYSRDMDLDYFESYDTSRNIRNRRDYSLLKRDLELLVPKKPDDPSYFHNYPLCPNCGTYMIYHFENCPKCGQHLDWSGFTEG